MKYSCAYADLKFVLWLCNTDFGKQKAIQPAIGSCGVQVSAVTLIMGLVQKEEGRLCLLAKENSKAVCLQVVHSNPELLL